MRSWGLELEGHSVVVTIEPAGPTFVGFAKSDGYGQTILRNGRIADASLSCDANIEGHEVHITANILPNGDLSGTAKVGWFFTARFKGKEIK